MDFDSPNFSVLHEMMLIVSVYAAMRSVDLFLLSDNDQDGARYGHWAKGSFMKVVSILCLLVFGFYVVAALAFMMGSAS